MFLLALMLAWSQSIATSSQFWEQLQNIIIYLHPGSPYTGTRCDRCREQKIVDGCYTNRRVQHETGFFTAQDGSYDTIRDFLPLKTVHTTPNRISYRSRRRIRHQTRFITAQDRAYNTERDFLTLKTVHTTPNGISSTISIPITTHNSKHSQYTGWVLCQFISSSTHYSLLSHHQMTFIVVSQEYFSHL